MMKNFYKLILPVVRGFVYGAMAIQIVLGILYIGSNLMAVPQFQETARYLEMAETLVVDEYTGILYPLLLRLCSILPVVPFQIPLYLIQIFVAVFCVYHFACTWTDRKGVALGCSLWINTIPFVAQAHVTVLPHSLVFSFLVLMLLEVLKGTKHKEPLNMMDFAVLLCSYTILVQLGREYFFAGTLLVVWAILLQIYHKEQKVLLFGVTTLISLGILISNLAIYKGTQTQGAYGRIQRSFQAVVLQRVGMSTMKERFMIYMPNEIRECFTGNELEEFAKYPYKLQTEFGPVLEDCYGKKYANELYWKLGLLGFGNATKDSVKSIAEDTLNYAMPAGVYFTWRDGNEKGITSWNYQQFIEQAPALSVMYVTVCQCLWLLGFGLCTAVGIMIALHRRNLYMRIWLPVVTYVGAYALYFALQGENIYDYKLALLPLALSYAWIACVFFRKERALKEEIE